MPIHVYRCRGCGYTEDVRQGWGDAVLAVCPSCQSPLLARVPQAPLLVHAPAGASGRGGGRPLVRPYVTYERDGSETVYGSAGEALRGERERTGSAALAARNVAHIAKLGYIAGTRAAALAEAITPLKPGEVPR